MEAHTHFYFILIVVFFLKHLTVCAALLLPFHPLLFIPKWFHNESQYIPFSPLIIILLDKLPLLFIIVMITFIIIIIIYSSLSQLKHACQKLISLITTKLNFIYLIHWFLNDARRESIYLGAILVSIFWFIKLVIKWPT